MVTKAKFAEFFITADTDGDGFLSQSDLGYILRKNGYYGTDWDILKLFKETDQDLDERISYEEYMRAMGHEPDDYQRLLEIYERHFGPRQQEQQESPKEIADRSILRRIFSLFDRDNSGEIDKKELKHIFAELGNHMTDDEIHKMMELADEDGSGSLNYEEFIEVVMAASEKEKNKK